MDRITEFIKKNKAVLLVLAVGAALMLMPTGRSAGTAASAGASVGAEGRIEAILAECEGVGRVRVMVGERDGEPTGCVVVCEGAESARVRLEVTEACSRLTGLGQDRIRVITMKGGER